MTLARLLPMVCLQMVLAGGVAAADQRKPAAPTPPGLTEIPEEDGAVPLIAPQQAPGEPEIVIRTQGDTRVEEYRRDGRTYMVRVTPRVGPPYYLIDIAGDGRFVRHDGAAPVNAPAQWRILQF